MNLVEKAKKFILNEKEYPVIAGFCIGFYMLAFYYSNNFELAHSGQQLLFFIGYYILMPMLVLYCVHSWVKSRLPQYTRQVLFILTASFFLVFILQNLGLLHLKILALSLIGIILVSFKVKNHKILLVVVAFMSVFPLIKIGQIIIRNASNPSDWNKQPDSIANTKFVKFPNVYFIEVDGYANAETLKNPLYRYDNSKFDDLLKNSGFTLYDSFRSNYNSTLLSNASLFNMKHHYSRESTNFKNSADYILGDNPVLNIFKKNGYKTFFITERPYLMMNRPKIKFDYCNFEISELPFLKDGWSFYKEITSEIKTQISNNKGTRNFFFIEKFDPGHVSVLESQSKGKEEERIEYLRKLEIANAWLTDMLAFIKINDPNALVIIGADHSGFVGFEHTGQVFKKIHDKDSLNSVFGAKLAVKWNDSSNVHFDKKLRTSVNLFRTVFSFLSQDAKLLNHLQPDVSYHNYDKKDLRKIYKAIY